MEANALAYVLGSFYAIIFPHVFLRTIQKDIWLKVLRHNGVAWFLKGGLRLPRRPR